MNDDFSKILRDSQFIIVSMEIYEKMIPLSKECIKKVKKYYEKKL